MLFSQKKLFNFKREETGQILMGKICFVRSGYICVQDLGDYVAYMHALEPVNSKDTCMIWKCDDNPKYLSTCKLT